MADDADIANNFIDAEVIRALGRIQDTAKNNKPGPKVCPECGEDIPDARRKLGFQLCIECAAETERRKSMFAGY